MLRQLLAILLIIVLLAGNLCAGIDQHADQFRDSGGCSISSGCDAINHPAHGDMNGSHGSHCCDTHHSHLQAVAASEAGLYHPVHDKQFTAVIPHFSPSDHLQERFIPPRHTA